MEMEKLYIDNEAIVNRSLFEGVKDIVTCVICTGIIREPKQCSTCENVFCGNCVEEWISKSPSCPFKCKNFVYKDCSRTTKNLLDKLIFKCPNKCSSSQEMNYEIYVKHVSSCENKKCLCPTCGTSVLQSNLKENREVKELQTRNYHLEAKLQAAMGEINSLKEEIRILHSKPTRSNERLHSGEHSKNRMKDEKELGLIDKCEHFRGNYKPIFICCNKAYPCYICHNEKQSHSYEFSNKVVCLICSNIYSGSSCNECKAVQVYRKK